MSFGELKDVDFSYRGKSALDGISLTLTGGITALLGPNGSGKTTLMRLLALQYQPSRGEVTIGGTRVTSAKEARAAYRSIGYLPQSFDIPGWKRVIDVVQYSAWARGIAPDDCLDYATAVLERVGLSDRARARSFQLSGGMRQRLGIACAIVHRPTLSILDEPTVGVDPVQRGELRKIFVELGNQGAVLLSTHLVDDVAHISDRVVVLSDGRITFDGTVEELAEIGRHAEDSGIPESDVERGYKQVLAR